MSSTRTSYPSRIADLGFSMETPSGFAPMPLPEEQPDFSNPTYCVPLVVVASQVAAALVSVSARPAYENGSVYDWIGYLCKHYELTITRTMPGHVGGPNHRHPAIFVDCQQEQDGRLVRYRTAALEDGGRFVAIQGMAPDELWAAFGEELVRAVASFELATPRGPTAPIIPGQPVPALEAVASAAE